MNELTNEQLDEIMKTEHKQLIYVYTPFCATCQLAEKMLRYVSEMKKEIPIKKMNASFFPEFMQEHQIESVPALIQVHNGVVQYKMYAFESVTNIFEKIDTWQNASNR
ncbi:thioredoxin-like negative regulator of GroEL [Gracilibacillus halotolerans]|uniref:Thioredoxin-like negative regulator of GroEL n=1 Tax=Gracilibacillus halotolerans TaxID=74386 RepID=A0A841RSL0_9BACI|nr:thioredoxin family protein [Gracilibacillus halotolerans]MBB6514185.1 thioredoxin-like negative regulator of GroEL [Gracilibacillus halotolerans]